jgi:4-hydroxy-tetrahydrodipicolinate synthase
MTSIYDGVDKECEVLCPLLTPFADEAIDEASLTSLVKTLLDAGMDGLVPCGTTGEFASLTEQEYQQVLETTVNTADGQVPVIAGTAATSIPSTLDRLKTARTIGADAGLVTLPYFHTANAPSGSRRFLSTIARESPLPIYLYNIPSCTGESIPPETVASLAEENTVHGLKDSSGDFNYFERLLELTPADFELYQGFDSYLVPGTLQGATGGINALSNAIPEAFVAAADAVAEEDLGRARRINTEHIVPLFQHCVEHGFAPGTKVASAARGFIPDVAVRPPLVEIESDARDSIETTVTSIADEYE